MRIKVEPKDFFMYSVFLAFSREQPEPEDEAVKAYLDEHELIPKARGTDRLDDRDFDVMYFGGCYIGGHLRKIEDMQRVAIEQEMLAAEIEKTVKEAADPAIRGAADKIPEPELKVLIASLAEEFRRESSFGTDEEGYLQVTLDSDPVRRRFTEVAENRA